MEKENLEFKLMYLAMKRMYKKESSSKLGSKLVSMGLAEQTSIRNGKPFYTLNEVGEKAYFQIKAYCSKSRFVKTLYLL